MILRRTLSIVLSLSLVLAAASASAAQEIEYRPVEDPMFGISSVVPADWQDFGSGVYTRGTPPQDLASIIIQSAPVGADQIWPNLLRQLALNEPPEPSGEYGTDGFDWTLYDVVVPIGSIEVAVGLAISEADGTTNVLMLQSVPEEAEELRRLVLEPALDAFALLAPEPTPDPASIGYSSEEVTFAGGSEGVELAGTLTLPAGAGPHPVVITMTGSGPQDRNESLKPITLLEPFAVIADALTEAGVGVLRYDDRGVGGSTGDYNAATISELAEDARAAIDYLETRDDVDLERIGLFGHSEGGLYAAMLGATEPRVAWIGMMAPAVIDGVDLIVEQNVAISLAEGEPVDQAQAVGEWSAEAMPLARDGDFEALERSAGEFFGRLWDELSPEERELAGERETFVQQRLDAQMPIYTSDWYRAFLGYDATVDWAEVDVPVLAIFGGKDVQVIAESNEAALLEALEAAGNDDVTTLTFPDANHLFQEAVTGAYSEYRDLEPEFIEGFVETVVDWTVERAGVAE